MKPNPFDVVRPRELGEALAVLSRLGRDARVLADGQSPLPLLNLRLVRPRVLVEVNPVPGLDYVQHEDGALLVGATVRQRRLELDPGVQSRFPLPADALPLIGRYLGGALQPLVVVAVLTGSSPRSVIWFMVATSAAVLIFILAIARRTTGRSLMELSRRRSGLT